MTFPLNSWKVSWQIESKKAQNQTVSLYNSEGTSSSGNESLRLFLWYKEITIRNYVLPPDWPNANTIFTKGLNLDLTWSLDSVPICRKVWRTEAHTENAISKIQAVESWVEGAEVPHREWQGKGRKRSGIYRMIETEKMCQILKYWVRLSYNV